MLLRCVLDVDLPASEFVMQEGDFLEAKIVEVVRQIKDADGKVVSSEKVSMPKMQPQSRERKYHIGETCDMYSVENLQRAGVRLSVVDVEGFIKPNLDRQSRLMDLANDKEFVNEALDLLSDEKPVNVSPVDNVIKFD